MLTVYGMINVLSGFCGINVCIIGFSNETFIYTLENRGKNKITINVEMKEESINR